MKKHILLLLLIWSFISINSYAEGPDNERSKAVISGRIIDNENLPLPGASVYVESISKGTISDVNGFFRLTGLKGGKYLVSVSYIGFKPKTQEISVREGETAELNFEMEAGIDIKEVVINGALQGQSKALNQQKNSMNITNIISSDQVTRFPDANIGDALKRIPGINVQYD